MTATIDAGEDADQAEQRPQADDREGALPERQRIDHARQQHLLGDRHDAERDAGHHHQKVCRRSTTSIASARL